MPRNNRAKTSKKNAISIHINSSLLYAERTIWSQRFKAWARYHVDKPRLPRPDDLAHRWVDHADNCPKTFSGFTGKHNDAFFQALNALSDSFEANKSFPEVTIVHGPPGSGKSAAVKVFAQRLVDELNLNNSQTPRWCLQVDGAKYARDFNALWLALARFAEAPLERFIPVKFRLVVVDNFDAIPPSNQQQLKKVMEGPGAGRLRYVFVTTDPKTTMIGYVAGKTAGLRTKVISEKDALLVILALASRNHIGYEREGIRELFALHPERSLSAMVDLMQQVFAQRHFVSKENVNRISGKTSELPVLTPTAAIEPMERCAICTLHPPCNHFPLERLTAMGVARRKELPRYKTGSMSCPEFVRYGRCSIFNRHGHCSLDHPKNLHVVQPPAKRCPQCTIPWPCGHCAFTADRLRLQAVIEELQRRIRRLRSINVPEPSLALVKHLESVPNWKQHIAKIESAYMTSNNTSALRQAAEWLDTRTSTSKDEYNRRSHQLIEGFGELYRTDMLADSGVSSQGAESQANEATPATS